MPTAVIIDAVRTPTGKRNGVLRDWHPTDLSAHVLRALVERNDSLDPALIDDVVWGCGSQVGEQAGNIGRYAALSAGLPESVPGTTVQRQCGSSQQAIHFAAQGVIAGAYDVVAAGGVESMTRVPIGSSTANGPGRPEGARLTDRYANPTRLVHTGLAAEALAQRYGIARVEMDELAVASHQRAARATAEGRFAREIVPVPLVGGPPVISDQGIRPDSSLEALAALAPAFRDDGLVTAGTSSQIADGAAGLLITSDVIAARLGLTPRARFHSFSVVGSDPVAMLTGPIDATSRALDRGGLRLDDIDVIEINEAFASVVLAWARELRPDMARVNPNGGAIALGHPIGASGARLMTTMLGELERTGGRFGLQTMCEGGGTANATIIERLA